MNTYSEGQTVHIIEPDGIALGHYIEYSDKKGGHKVRTNTSSNDFKIIKDELLTADYHEAKRRLLSTTFQNKHFKQY